MFPRSLRQLKSECVCSSSGEKGVLYRWQGYFCRVTPERLLLSRPVLHAALGTVHGLLLTEGPKQAVNDHSVVYCCSQEFTCTLQNLGFKKNKTDLKNCMWLLDTLGAHNKSFGHSLMLKKVTWSKIKKIKLMIRVRVIFLILSFRKHASLFFSFWKTVLKIRSLNRIRKIYISSSFLKLTDSARCI